MNDEFIFRLSSLFEGSDSENMRKALMIKGILSYKLSGYGDKVESGILNYIKRSRDGEPDKLLDYERINLKGLKRTLYYQVSHHNTITKTIKELEEAGYLKRYQRWCNKNEHNVLKSDKSYSYWIDLVKICKEMSAKGLLENHDCFWCNKTEFSFIRIANDKKDPRQTKYRKKKLTKKPTEKPIEVQLVVEDEIYVDKYEVQRTLLQGRFNCKSTDYDYILLDAINTIESAEEYLKVYTGTYLEFNNDAKRFIRSGQTIEEFTKDV